MTAPTRGRGRRDEPVPVDIWLDRSAGLLKEALSQVREADVIPLVDAAAQCQRIAMGEADPSSMEGYPFPMVVMAPLVRAAAVPVLWRVAGSPAPVRYTERELCPCLQDGSERAADDRRA